MSELTIKHVAKKNKTMKKKKVKSYPIYFKRNKWVCCCLLNKKESIRIDLYGWRTSIEYEIEDNGTWIHKMWKTKFNTKEHETNKSEFKKAVKTAMKILQEKL